MLPIENNINVVPVSTTTVKMYWSEGSLPTIYPNSQPGYWNEELSEEVLHHPGQLVSLFSSELYRESLGGYINARLMYIDLYKAFLTNKLVSGEDPYYWLIRKEGKFYPLPMYWSELSDQEKEKIIKTVEILLSLNDDGLYEFLEKN